MTSAQFFCHLSHTELRAHFPGPLGSSLGVSTALAKCPWALNVSASVVAERSDYPGQNGRRIKRKPFCFLCFRKMALRTFRCP